MQPWACAIQNEQYLVLVFIQVMSATPTTQMQYVGIMLLHESHMLQQIHFKH